MIKITCEPTRWQKYAITSDYSPELVAFFRGLKERHGFSKFTWYLNKWRFTDENIYWEIKERYPEAELDPLLDYLFAVKKVERTAEIMRIKNAEVIKAKRVSDIGEIKGLKLPLREYQLLGVEFLVNNNGRALLMDSCGLGKSCQALSYALYTQKRKTLIISPASVKGSWVEEVKKMTSLKAFVIKSNEKYSDSDILQAFTNNDILIINYDLLKKYFSILIALKFDCCILDEVSLIKNIRAQRVKLTKQITKNIPSVILLSATPLLNTPADLFNSLNILDPKQWSSWYSFTTRYCNGHRGRWGWDYSGSSNLDELKEKISRYYLRREKEDVLTELPPKRFIDVPVELSLDYSKEYKAALNNFYRYLRDIKKKKTPEIAKSMAAEKLVQLSTLRQLASLGKTEAAEEKIEEVVGGNGKVLFFSSFNASLEVLHERFKGQSVLLTGKTKTEERTKIIKEFNENPKIKIFFLGILSGGIGLNLQVASSVIFDGYPYRPADLEQAWGRVDRIGQKADSIAIYQMYSPGTIDGYMKDILEEKKQTFDYLFGETALSASGESIVNELLARMEADK